MTKPDIIVNTVFSIVALSGWAVVFMMEPEPRIVEVEVEAEPVVIEKPTTVFLVDGVTCWAKMRIIQFFGCYFDQSAE